MICLNPPTVNILFPKCPKTFDFWKKIGDITAVSGKKSDLARCYRHLFAIFGLYLMEYGWAKKMPPSRFYMGLGGIDMFRDVVVFD